MMNVKEMPMEAFRHIAVNRNIIIKDSTGVVFKEEKRVIDVIDGELDIGNYNAQYTCGSNVNDIVKTDVEEFKLTKLIRPANHYVELMPDIKDIVSKVSSYSAAVQLVEKHTDYCLTGEKRETIETSLVFLVEG